MSAVSWATASFHQRPNIDGQVKTLQTISKAGMCESAWMVRSEMAPEVIAKNTSVLVESQQRTSSYLSCTARSELAESCVWEDGRTALGPKTMGLAKIGVNLYAACLTGETILDHITFRVIL